MCPRPESEIKVKDENIMKIKNWITIIFLNKN